MSHAAPRQKRTRRPARTEAEDRDHPGESDEEQEDLLAHCSVSMAVCSTGNRLGIAVYDPESHKLSAFQGHEELKGPLQYQLLRIIKLQTSPNVIYASSKADPELLAALEQPVFEPDAEEGAVNKFQVKLERVAAFHYDKALQRLERLHVAGHAPGASAKEHLSLLNTMVDLEREQQVCALGAMLMVLQKATAIAHEGGDDGIITVQCLTELNLQSFLVVDPVTLGSLQIMQDEQHASMMGIGTAREGFSLFSLLNRCVSPMGKRLLRTWFLRPSTHLGLINDRLDTVQLLMEGPGLCKELQELLKQVGDVPRLLLRLAQCPTDLRCYVKLQSGLEQLMQLRARFTQLTAAGQEPEVQVQVQGQGPGRQGGHAEDAAGAGSRPLQWDDVTVTHQVQSRLGEPLSGGHTLMSEVVDPGQGDEGWLVAEGVCQELDRLKATYQGLPDLLTRVLEAELARIPPHLARVYLHDRQLWLMTYLPQVGYAIQVTARGLPEELLEVLPDYQHAFDMSTPDGSVVLYSTDSTRELSERYGDMLYKIQDLEATVCRELVGRLQQHAPALHAASEVAATLDCLVAFALTASQLKYCRPTVTLDNVLHVQGGRHPLTEIVTPQTYIPNNTHMDSGADRVHVITGPNASGKSCYAKQVALITFMAHLGCWVPADSAVIGVTDRILTRLVSTEQVAAGASSFMSDLTQVLRMVNQATGRSLLVIDEFGKGTLAADGLGLLSSLLTQFCDQQEPPRLLACTHFHELMDPDIMPRSPMLKFCTMEVLVQGVQGLQATGSGNRSAPDNQEVVFLYRLVDGYCAPSFGIRCAQLCGVRPAVVERAVHVLSAHQARQTIDPVDAALDAPRCQRYALWASQLVDLLQCDNHAEHQLAAAVSLLLEASGADPGAGAHNTLKQTACLQVPMA